MALKIAIVYERFHENYLQRAWHGLFQRVRHDLCPYDDSSMCFYVINFYVFNSL